MIYIICEIRNMYYGKKVEDSLRQEKSKHDIIVSGVD